MPCAFFIPQWTFSSGVGGAETCPTSYTSPPATHPPHPGPPFRAFSPTPHYGCRPLCCADGPPSPPPPLLCGPGAWTAGRESSEQKGVATFQVPPLNMSGQWPRPLPASPPALRSKPTQPGSLGEWTLLQPHRPPRTRGCTQLPFCSWLPIPHRACPLIPPT